MKQSKRDLLKALAVSTAWTTPVVSTVVLPVHAQTSCNGTFVGPLEDGCFDPGACVSITLVNCERVAVSIESLQNETFNGGGVFANGSFDIWVSNTQNTIGVNGVISAGSIVGAVEGGDCSESSSFTAELGVECIPADGPMM